MRLLQAAVLALCILGTELWAQTPKTHTIQPGDITKAMDAFIATDQKEDFAQKILVPVFRATEFVMVRQMPNAPELAAEMAQALYIIWDYPKKELTDIAARAFLNRPDLFHASFDSINPDERSKAVAAIVCSWGELRDNLEKDPQTTSTTRARMDALTNIIEAWKCKYPQYVPKRWL